MGQFPKAAHGIAYRIAGVLLLAAVLAGCDRCGDFVPPIKFGAQVCKDMAPRPQ
jgi:hypothetical protein